MFPHLHKLASKQTHIHPHTINAENHKIQFSFGFKCRLPFLLLLTILHTASSHCKSRSRRSIIKCIYDVCILLCLSLAYASKKKAINDNYREMNFLSRRSSSLKEWLCRWQKMALRFLPSMCSLETYHEASTRAFFCAFFHTSQHLSKQHLQSLHG